MLSHHAWLSTNHAQDLYEEVVANDCLLVLSCSLPAFPCDDEAAEGAVGVDLDLGFAMLTAPLHLYAAVWYGTDVVRFCDATPAHSSSLYLADERGGGGDRI